MTVFSSPTGRSCGSAKTVFIAGESGQVWRIAEGLVRLDRGDGLERQTVQIAAPGDLIGTEALCQQAYRFTATALTPCLVEPVSVGGAEARALLLQQALMQQQTRSLDMAALRTGTVFQRITHFLSLLGIEWKAVQARAHADSVRALLPALREIAQVVDAKTETVCRVLGQLLPPRSKKPALVHSPGTVRVAVVGRGSRKPAVQAGLV